MKVTEQSIIITLLTQNPLFFEHSHRLKPDLFLEYADLVKVIHEEFTDAGETSIQRIELNTKHDLSAWIGLINIAGFEENLELLKKRFQRSRLKDYALNVVAELDNNRDALELSNWFSDKATDLFLDKQTELSYIGGSYTAVMDSILGARDGLPGISSGFKEIDELIPGWQPTNLVVLAARPGMGKTALALQYAMTAARSGKVVAFASCEMTSEQLIIRLISTDLEINAERINRGKLTGAEMDEINNWFERNLKTPLVIFHPRDFHDCLNTLRSLHMRTGLGMVVIDYLQLLGLAPERGRSREREISIMSSGFKAFALQNKIPVMLLSQLNRDVEKRGDKRPLLADLRESGAIEQDADIVQFIYREQYYDSTAPDDAEIITTKHRGGRTGISTLKFKGEFTKFIRKPDPSFPDAPF